MLDGALHIRVTRIAQVPKCGRQIAWADKNTVHALGGGDGIHVIDTLLTLNLYQNGDVAVGLRKVVRYGAKHVGAMRNGDAADPSGG